MRNTIVIQAQIARPLAARVIETPGPVTRSAPGLPQGFEVPGDPRLVVDCPHCGRAVPHPGRAGDGSPALAACQDPACDVYFEFDPSRAYAPTA